MLITWGKKPKSSSYGVVRMGSEISSKNKPEMQRLKAMHVTMGATKLQKTAQSLRENFKMFELFVNPTCSLGLDNLS